MILEPLQQALLILLLFLNILEAVFALGHKVGWVGCFCHALAAHQQRLLLDQVAWVAY